MDEDEFRATYRDVNTSVCVYEKSILAGRSRCRFAQKLNIAEREAISCQNTLMQTWCGEVLHRLIENSNFALHIVNTQQLTHAQAMKVQVGGITGVARWYESRHEGKQETDVSQLIYALRQHDDYQSAFPWQEIIRHIVNYRTRAPRGE